MDVDTLLQRIGTGTFRLTKDTNAETKKTLKKLMAYELMEKIGANAWKVTPKGIKLSLYGEAEHWIKNQEKVMISKDSLNERYILYLKTVLDQYSIIDINIESVGYILDHIYRKMPEFSLGGTKYVIEGLLETKIFKFDSREDIDKALKSIKWSKDMGGSKYIKPSELYRTATDVTNDLFKDDLLNKSGTKTNKDILAGESSLTEDVVDIFISHSSKDEEKANLLIEILRSALNLSIKQIRCTSVEGFMLEAGDDTDEKLRMEILYSKIFIAALTKESIKSTYVLFEIGGRWVSKKTLLPIVLDKNKSEIIQGPLSGIHCLDGTKKEQFISLVDKIGKLMNIVPESANVYLSKVEELASLCNKS